MSTFTHESMINHHAPNLFSQVVNTLHVWRQRYRARQELSKWTDRELHDIGQTIVTIMLENAGFRVINLGTDTHPDKFIDAAKREKADLVGFSALLSTTIYYQKVTIEEFAKAGLRSKVKILVGGAPTSQQWADEIGADGWGKDAMLAVQLAKRLVKEPREAWE